MPSSIDTLIAIYDRMVWNGHARPEVRLSRTANGGVRCEVHIGDAVVADTEGETAEDAAARLLERLRDNGVSDAGVKA